MIASAVVFGAVVFGVPALAAAPLVVALPEIAHYFEIKES
jgi:hypothetical protein